MSREGLPEDVMIKLRSSRVGKTYLTKSKWRRRAGISVTNRRKISCKGTMMGHTGCTQVSDERSARDQGFAWSETGLERQAEGRPCRTWQPLGTCLYPKRNGKTLDLDTWAWKDLPTERWGTEWVRGTEWMWEDEVTRQGPLWDPARGDMAWTTGWGGRAGGGERWSCHHSQKLAEPRVTARSVWLQSQASLYLTIWSFIQRLVTNPLPCAQACARCWGYSCEQTLLSWNLQPRR